MSILNLKADFPLFKTYPDLIYFDSAATSQKPQCVIDALVDYYISANANPHRGVYELSVHASELFEATRKKVADFIHAAHVEEIIFTRGTTDSINSVAISLARSYFQEGDEIIISEMEHHSNIVPWQLIAIDKKLKLKVIPLNDQGELELEAFEKLLTPKTKLVAITYISNALGTINPISQIIKMAHAKGVLVLVDGAQAVGHINVDVQKIDADFFVFSGHKAYGPTGVGVLYGKKALLEKLSPAQGGGGMIDQVFFDKTTYASLPSKFEAGTPMVAEVVAFKSSFDYLEKIGLEKIFKHEHELLTYATEKLLKIEGLKIIGQAKDKAAIISFVIEGTHPLDIATFLDLNKIAVRSGHHCAQPAMRRFQVPATVRVSFGVYNTKAEIDQLEKALQEVILELKK